VAERIPGAQVTSEQGRFGALDLLRGVAAVMVMFLHANDHYAGLFSPQSGYLAVDLFFLLSGFVIANAYDSRFNAGWHPLEFVKVRLIRLYPLYFLAILMGALKLLIQFRVGVSPPSMVDAGMDIGFGLFMLPSPSTLGHRFDPPFPIDLAAWSLFFELIMNLAYAFAHKWLRPAVLLGVVALSGAALIIVILVHGSAEVGNYWRTLAFGIPRAMFPFFLGILINRTRVPMPRLGSLWALFLALALFVVLIVAPGSARPLWDIGLIFVFFPVLVVAGSAVAVKGAVERVSLFAGLTSYAMYVLHLPTMSIADSILKRLAPMWSKSPVFGPLFMALIVVACWAIDRFYDMPVRRWLSRRLRRAPKLSLG